MAKTLHYNFLTSPTLTGSEHPIATSPDLSITRATKATMVDADGYIREVQAGEARFTGTTFAHNLIRQSNTFDTTWTNDTLATITGGQADPDGGTNAWLWSDDGGGGTTLINITTAVQEVSTGGVYRFSAKVKATGSAGWIYLSPEGSFTPNTNATYFQLSGAGTVGTSTAVDEGITSLGDGWYEVWMDFTVSSSDLAGSVNFYMADGDNDRTVARDGTSTYLLYQAMVERVTAASVGRGTYVETTTVPVTSLTGTSTKGILVEEARTNIALQSEDFSSANWTKDDVTIDANAGTGADGSTTADRMNVSTTASYHRVYQTLSGMTANANYTWSVFVTDDGAGVAGITGIGGSENFGSVIYDLTTKTVSATDTGSVNGSVVASGVDDYGNGILRLWATLTVNSTTPTFYIFTASSTTPTLDSFGLESFTPSDGEDLILWGAQVEAGAFPTSYIATTTASVTRNADDVSTTDVSWIDGTKGSYYVSASNDTGDTNTQRYLWNVSSGNTTTMWRLYVDQASTRTGQAVSQLREDGGAAYSALSGNNDYPLDGTTYRFVAGFDSSGDSFYVNGNAETTGGSSNVNLLDTTPVNDMRFGANVGSTGSFNGHIAETAYFNERLANATLQDYSLNGLPTAFPGTVAGDGGHIWPARSNDPRWAQIITDSGITPSGNFIDDVHAALEAMASTTGAMDDLWKKVKAVYSITDTSEPFTY